MKYVRIALLSAAAIYLLPFATPAYAELGHPSGCAQCGPVAITSPTGRAPVIGPELRIGVPPEVTPFAIFRHSIAIVGEVLRVGFCFQAARTESLAS